MTNQAVDAIAAEVQKSNSYNDDFKTLENIREDIILVMGEMNVALERLNTANTNVLETVNG